MRNNNYPPLIKTWEKIPNGIQYKSTQIRPADVLLITTSKFRGHSFSNGGPLFERWRYWKALFCPRPLKGRPSATSLTKPKEPLIITQLKIPIGIKYKRAMQRCSTWLLSPDKEIKKRDKYLDE